MKFTTFHKGSIIIIGLIIILSLFAISGEFGFRAIEIILGIILCWLLWSVIRQTREKFAQTSKAIYAKDSSLKLLATLMGFFLVLGTLQYMYVFRTVVDESLQSSDTPHPIYFSNIEYLLRSLICSLDLFMLDVDTNLLDRLDQKAALKGWLAVQSVLSFSCTVAMLIGLAYSRLHAYLRLNYHTRISDNRNHLYLFFGDNKPSEILIKDISKNDPKAIPIIIDEANLKEDDNDEWEGIVGFVTHRQSIFNKADKIGAHVAVASKKLDDIETEITDSTDFDAFRYLGISKIRNIIERAMRTSNPQLHIFFMDNDEELNIRNIMVLAKDKTMKEVSNDKNLHHCIYCHARFNGPNRVIQDVAIKKSLNIKIVDSSHLAVELLKFDKDCHPANVVKYCSQKPSTVESPFKALIIGFGEVGRDAFRFLYEFGAFLDSNDEDSRNPFECVIVDKELDNIQGTFMSAMPAIFSTEKKLTGKVDISFEALDCHSENFYAKVLSTNFLKEVNYVIISIGDNDEAISLATRIFSKIRRVREDLSNLRIFVRCTDDNKSQAIQKIADHYNFGYANGDDNTPVINVFGQPEKTYTYDMVISDRLIEEAKKFHEKYRSLSNEGCDWDTRHQQVTSIVPPNIDKLRKLRRQESQDKANALHAGTKIIVFERAMEALSKKTGKDFDRETFFYRFFNPDGTPCVKGNFEDIIYPHLSEEENAIILNLAKLEHLRWIAAHELLGYEFNSDGNSCDERTMRHNCLCPWSLLDHQSIECSTATWKCDYKKYDFCVIDTTLTLYKDNNAAI